MQKDIQLCGMGNGLVDLLVEVEDSVLTELALRKGEMILVDAEKQKKVVEKFANQKQVRCSGGSAANSVIAFSALGGKAAYKTVLGDDEMGRFYAKEFEDLGILLKAPLINDAPTGTCFVLVSPDSERTMHTSLGATGHFGPDHVYEDIIARSEWLYVEGYKFDNPNSTAALFAGVDFAKKHNTKIALTFSDIFIIELFKENLEKAVKASDLIFCNENEAKRYTEKDNFEDAFAELCKQCPNVVVTRGSEGSSILWEGKRYEIPSYPASPVDTTGAGDMFAGTFLYGIINHGDANKAGNLASLTAAKIVSQIGARMKSDINLLKEQIK